MTFSEIALRMFPLWLLGGSMVAATAFSGFSDLLRIDKKAMAKFGIFLVILNLYRIVMFKLFGSSEYLSNAMQAVNQIPVGATLTVFWEDAAHGLPLVLLGKFLGDSKPAKAIYYLALMMVMLSFGSGHIYQGYFASLLLMLYVPYSIKLGKQYGFGTVMLGHTLYDLTTILAIKHFLGVL